MSLDEFIEFQTKKLDLFNRYWKEQNWRDPKNFPSELPDSNSELWFELFDGFQPWRKNDYFR